MGWSNWDVRVYAARGLMAIIRQPSVALPALLDQLDVLLEDPVSAVRLQVAERLHFLHEVAPDRMWAMAERVVRNETEPGVLAFFLDRAAKRFMRLDPERSDALFGLLRARLADGLGGDARDLGELKTVLGRTVAGLHVGLGRAFAQDWLKEWTTDFSRNSGELHDFLNSLRSAFFARYAKGATAKACAECDRAQEDLTLIVQSAVQVSGAVHAVLIADGTESAEREAAAKGYKGAELTLSQAMNQLYFGSGAYANSQGQGAVGLPDAAAMKAFLADYRAVLAMIAQTHEPDVLHHLVQLYEFLIPADPEAVFDAIHAVLFGRGQEENYQHESLASSVVVPIVKRYLADHRALFEDPARRTKLTNVLRLFSEVGWQDALKLFYELPELLR